MKIYIINPDNGKPVTIKDWRKDADPKRALLLAIETDDDHLLLMRKSYLPGDHTFEEAQKACAGFITPELGSTNITFRCPTRKECIDIYDARFQGLDEAIELTGGDYAKRGRWHWTSERDSDPKYANHAWCSYGGNGFLTNYYYMYSSNLALPVALLK